MDDFRPRITKISLSLLKGNEVKRENKTRVFNPMVLCILISLFFFSLLLYILMYHLYH